MAFNTVEWVVVAVLVLYVGKGMSLSFPGPSSATRLAADRRLGRGRAEMRLSAKLVVGVNKYSHDASVCIVDADSGEVLFAQAKERITGRKHVGGATGELLRYGLRSIDASVSDVSLVVSNNHHHRVLPFEKRVPFAVAQNYVPADYDDAFNLLPGAKHLELSHHLAHAWSVVGTSPMREGLVVVMDGMGEQYKAMVEDMGGLDEVETETEAEAKVKGQGQGDAYMHDLKLLRDLRPGKFVGVPAALLPGSSYREAESAYMFDGATLTPVFKRWSRERSPPELNNHGFENMESLGAVYSRISSQVLGDWNACGKVMGLASWSGRHRNEAKEWIFGPDGLEDVSLGEQFHHTHQFMTGNPLVCEGDGSFKIDWAALEGLSLPNSFSATRFGELALQASSVQDNLESSAMQLVASLKEMTGASNLAVVGGVALNSVLNGRLQREGGFDSVFVPPAPGDEGVAVGCALYGFHQLRVQGGGGGDGGGDGDGDNARNGAAAAAVAIGAEAAGTVLDMDADARPIAVKQSSFPAYQGMAFNEELIDDAVFEFTPWVIADQFDSMEECVDAAVESLAGGKVVAWFQGKSEFGQRALGHRSFLADPRTATMRRHVNEKVKDREWWRPLAPSVLAEHAGDWFEGLSNGGNESPYMSITASIRSECRAQVPSICHIDGTARLQTVTVAEAPVYHSLIKKFYAKTGVPMVMNTSFNRKGQPIVESPDQALNTLLACGADAVESLYIGRWKVIPRPFPLSEEEAHAAPTEEEGGLSVIAVPYYISEVVASPSVNVGPLRARVQDGRKADGDDEWTELPSSLHLELLQLLQPQDEASGSHTATEEELPDVTVYELWGAMGQMTTDCQWKDIREALKWLYEAQLLYFNGPDIGIDAGRPTALSRDMDVVDLRTP
jgi:carbamoyltransferase